MGPGALASRSSSGAGMSPVSVLPPSAPAVPGAAGRGPALARGANGSAGPLGATKPSDVPESAAGGRFTPGRGAGGAPADSAAGGGGGGGLGVPGANGSAGPLGATKPRDVPERAAGARLTAGIGGDAVAPVADDGLGAVVEALCGETGDAFAGGPGGVAVAPWANGSAGPRGTTKPSDVAASGARAGVGPFVIAGAGRSGEAPGGSVAIPTSGAAAHGEGAWGRGPAVADAGVART